MEDALRTGRSLCDKDGSLARVADVERMQMLVESPSRRVLQRMLAAWLPGLHELRARHKGLLRWAVDVDPLAI